MFSQNNEEKKLDWMYKGPTSTIDREEYLLGRSVDKSLDQLNAAEKQGHSSNPPKNHVEHECIPPSIRDFKKMQLGEQVDIAQKLQEDPLVAIKKREEETRLRLLQNPVQLKKLQKVLKLKKEKKKKKKSKKSKKHSDSSDSEANLDKKLQEQYAEMRKQRAGTSNMDEEEEEDLDKMLIKKFMQFKHLLTKSDLDEILNMKEESSDDANERKRKSGGNKYYSSSEDDEADRQNKRRSRSRSPNKNKGKFIVKNKRKETKYRSNSFDSDGETHLDNYSTRKRNLTRESGDKKDKYDKESSSRNRQINDYYRNRDASSSYKNSRNQNDNSEYRRNHEEKETYKSSNRSKDRKNSRHKSKSDSSDSDSDDSSDDNRKKSKKSKRDRSKHKRDDSESNDKHKSKRKNNVKSSKKKQDSSDSENERKPKKRRDSSSDSDDKRKSRKNHTKSSKKQHDSSDSEQERKPKKRRDTSPDKNNMKPSKKKQVSSDSENEKYAKKRKALKPELPKSKKSESDSSSSDEKIKERKRSHYDSEDDDRPKHKKNFGLVRADGTKIHLPKQSYNREETRDNKQVASTSQQKPYEKQKRKKLTEEEIEQRRKEMMQNAEWRDKERAQNVRRYRENDAKESKNQDYKPEFLTRELLKSANTSTVESRIKSNINNIQRSGKDMSTHFSRRY